MYEEKDFLHDPETIPKAAYWAETISIVNGRYRFRKVCGGLNWIPEHRSG